jgi:hypothetical protein
MHVLITCTNRCQEKHRHLLPEADYLLTYVGGAFHLRCSLHPLISAMETLRETCKQNIEHISRVSHSNCQRANHIHRRKTTTDEHAEALNQVGQQIQQRWRHVNVVAYFLDEVQVKIRIVNGVGDFSGLTSLR